MFRWLLIALWFACEAGLAEPKALSITVFDNHSEFIRLSPAYGLSWNLFEQAAHKANIQLVKSNTVWQGAQRRVKAHKSDLAFGALYSKERAKWAYFSLPMAVESSALYRPSWAQPKPLDKQQDLVGVSKGSMQARYAEKAGFTNIYRARSAFNLFSALNGERVDYALLSEAYVRLYCEDHPTRLCPKRVSHSSIQSTVHVITAKDNLAMVRQVKRLNQALLAISDSPEIRTLFQQYGYSREQYQGWQDSIQSASDINRP